jgi:hypothetical protein
MVVDSFPPLHPTMNRQDENIEVTDFFCWAIYSLCRVLSREYKRIQQLRWDTACTLEEEKEMISFVDGMQIFHTQAILDEEYLRDFLSTLSSVDKQRLVVTFQQTVLPFRPIPVASDSIGS